MPRFGKREKFLEKVRNTVAGLRLLAPGDRVLAAVSGGADSVALFHALLALSREWGLSLGVAHLDHGLRGKDSQEDARFVRELASAHGAPFFLEAPDVRGLAAREGISVEEAGRRARYDFLSRVCETHGFDRVATAHHADDNAEWVLMALFRGAGPAGLSGIPPRRGRVVRPLIRCTRAELIELLTESGIPWREDATNQDLAVARNRVRLRVLPFLENEVSPGVALAVNRTSGLLADEEDWWEQHLDSLLGPGFFSPGPDGAPGFSVSRMAALHPAPARRALRRGLLAAGVPAKSLSAGHVEAVRRLSVRGRDAGEIHLPGRITARRQGDRIEFVPRPGRGGAAPAGPAPEPWEEELWPGRPVSLPGGGAVFLKEVSLADVPPFSRVGPNEALLDADTVALPLVLRRPRPGDRFHPLGAPGSKKLKRFLMDQKMPRPDRARVVAAESAGTIAWLAGIRVAHPCRVTKATRRVFRLKLSLA